MSFNMNYLFHFEIERSHFMKLILDFIDLIVYMLSRHLKILNDVTLFI
jgi:hypothetical protein